MKVEKLEEVKIKDAFYFPNPGAQYKKTASAIPGRG